MPRPWQPTYPVYEFAPPMPYGEFFDGEFCYGGGTLPGYHDENGNYVLNQDLYDAWLGNLAAIDAEDDAAEAACEERNRIGQQAVDDRNAAARKQWEKERTAVDGRNAANREAYDKAYAAWEEAYDAWLAGQLPASGAVQPQAVVPPAETLGETMPVHRQNGGEFVGTYSTLEEAYEAGALPSHVLSLLRAMG